MEARVILIDQYDAFVERLSGRLNAIASDRYHVSNLSVNALALDKEVDRLKQASLLIVPSALKTDEFFSNHSFDAAVLCWDDPFEPSQNPTTGKSLRFIGIRALDRIIRHRLSKGESPTALETATRHMGCHLSFSEGFGARCTQHVLRHEMDLGHRVIYVPIKPLYRLQDPFRRGPDQTIGDLLCHIATGEMPEAERLGEYLYLHEFGYFTFRLPDRADDLIAADAHAMKQLIRLLRQYAESGVEKTVVWLDTSGLYLDKLLNIASLCDYLYIDVPQDESSASAVARRELGIFMAALPSSCAILELSE